MSVASPADSPIALEPSAGASLSARRVDWRSLGAVELVWFGFALIFTPLALPGGDATYAFAFLRALFGEKSHTVTGYQAGLSYFETPFYAIARVLSWLGVDSVFGRPIGPAAIALGMILLGGLTLAVAAGVVKALGFEHSSLVAGAAVFGTTVFFYATFSPGQTHTVDALTSTVVAALALGAFRRDWDLRWLVAVGVVVGIAMTVRYFDGAQAAGLGVVLLLHRRIRETVVLAVATAVAFGVFLIPVALVGVPLFGGGFSPNNYVSWSPASPAKMLFTDHRGVFVWTPLVFLGCVGLIRLIRTRRADRPFYLFVAASAVILLALCSTVAFWDAGWSFSNRYLTQFFPLVFVGVAGLVDWRPRLTGALGLVAVAWSVFLGLSLTTVQVFDLRHQGASDVARPVLSGRVSPGEFGYGLYAHSILLTRIAGSR
jgi:hypothetical protein